MFLSKGVSTTATVAQVTTSLPVPAASPVLSEYHPELPIPTPVTTTSSAQESVKRPSEKEATQKNLLCRGPEKESLQVTGPFVSSGPPSCHDAQRTAFVKKRPLPSHSKPQLRPRWNRRKYEKDPSLLKSPSSFPGPLYRPSSHELTRLSLLHLPDLSVYSSSTVDDSDNTSELSSVGSFGSVTVLGRVTRPSTPAEELPQPEGALQHDNDEEEVTTETKDEVEHTPALNLPGDDYYCVPTLQKLRQMTMQELSAVDSFEIGREGLGSIRFHGATDLRDVDLSSAVTIGEKSVLVYGGQSKPPQGFGLNKEATITLHKCFPIFKKKNATGDDQSAASSTSSTSGASPSRRSIRKYCEKVKRYSGRLGGELVDYNPSSGLWIWTAKHF